MHSNKGHCGGGRLVFADRSRRDSSFEVFWIFDCCLTRCTRFIRKTGKMMVNLYSNCIHSQMKWWHSRDQNNNIQVWHSHIYYILSVGCMYLRGLIQRTMASLKCCVWLVAYISDVSDECWWPLHGLESNLSRLHAMHFIIEIVLYTAPENHGVQTARSLRSRIHGPSNEKRSLSTCAPHKNLPSTKTIFHSNTFAH